jgi:hypothetical protein
MRATGGRRLVDRWERAVSRRTVFAAAYGRDGIHSSRLPRQPAQQEDVMRTWNTSIVAAVLVCAPAARADDAAQPPKSEAVHLNPKDMKWGDPPPDLPNGAKVTVLHGDPSKSGPFTIRLKAPSGYKVPPHWHTSDENLTVISGTLVLHMGDSMKADAHALSTGAYHFLPGKMHHGAETRGETIVQINGEGPFDIHYLNPADNPNPKSARK